MRRLAPRPLRLALADVARQSQPTTLLARVQAAWPEAAGAALAAVSMPVSESDGVITVACESGVWAHELELLGADLLVRLTSVPGVPPATADEPGLTRLRFVVGSLANRP